jgi:dipeptidyl aminopeptidase/acylaminoacyl peptidase
VSARDPVTSDPSLGAEPAASTPTLTITSAGVQLVSVLHVPSGPGPHPVVVLLHGFPGYERNIDVAQALRRAGYATLVLFYRGSWGMGGDWSWGHVLEDAAAAVAAVSTTAVVDEHRLDPSRLAVVGHSLGGFAALMSAASNPSITAVASVAGFDFGAVAEIARADPTVRASLVTEWDAELGPLHGTSGDALVAEMEAAGAVWSLSTLAPALAGRPVLLIGTSRDAVTPADLHHRPLVDAYLTYPIRRLEHHVFGTDHALSDHRIRLIRTLLDFLDRHLKMLR